MVRSVSYTHLSSSTACLSSNSSKSAAESMSPAAPMPQSKYKVFMQIPPKNKKAHEPHTVRAPPLAQFNPIKTRFGASTPPQLPAAINTVYRPKAMMSSQTRTAKSFPREKTQIFAKTGLTFAHQCIIITIVSSEQCVRLATNGFPVFII